MSDHSDSLDDSLDHPNNQWFDITDWIKNDAAQLMKGDFVYQSVKQSVNPSESQTAFSLFDCMSALEVMEKRMDPVQHARDLSNQQSLNQSLDPSINPIDQLEWSNEEALMQIDCLIALHAHHLSGLSMAHSLGLSKLIDSNQSNYKPIDPSIKQTINQSILHIVSKMIVHCSSVANSIVSQGDLYQDDEWQPSDFGVMFTETLQSADDQSSSQSDKSFDLVMHASDIINQASNQVHQESNNQPINAEIILRLKFVSSWLVFLTTLEGHSVSPTILPLFNQQVIPSWLELLNCPSWKDTAYQAKFSQTINQSGNSSNSQSTDQTIKSSMLDHARVAWLLLHAPPKAPLSINLSINRSVFHSLLSDLSICLSTCTMQSLNQAINLAMLMMQQNSHLIARSAFMIGIRNDHSICGSNLSLTQLLDRHVRTIHPTSAIWEVQVIASNVFHDLRALNPSLNKSITQSTNQSNNQSTSQTSKSNKKSKNKSNQSGQSINQTIVPADQSNDQSDQYPHSTMIPEIKSFFDKFLTATFEIILGHRQRSIRQSINQTIPQLIVDSELVDRWCEHLCTTLSMPTTASVGLLQRSFDQSINQSYCSTGFRAVAIDMVCQSLISQSIRKLIDRLIVHREFEYFYFMLYILIDRMVRANESAFRDPRVSSLLVGQYVETHSANQSNNQSSSQTNKKNNKKNKQTNNQIITQSIKQPIILQSLQPYPFNPSLLLLAVLSYASNAIVYLMHHLKAREKLVGDIQVDKFDDNDVKTFFMHRYHEYSFMTPLDYPFYQTFVQARLTPLTISETINQSIHCFKEAKELLSVVVQRTSSHPIWPARPTLEEVQSTNQSINQSNNPYRTRSLNEVTATPLDSGMQRRMLKAIVSNSVQLTMMAKSLANQQSNNQPIEPTHKAVFTFNACELIPVLSLKKIEKKVG